MQLYVITLKLAQIILFVRPLFILCEDGRGQKGNSEFVVKNIRKDHVNKTEGLDEI